MEEITKDGLPNVSNQRGRMADISHIFLRTGIFRLFSFRLSSLT